MITNSQVVCPKKKSLISVKKDLCKVFHAGLPAHFVLIAEMKNISVSCLPSGRPSPDDSSSQGHLLRL